MAQGRRTLSVTSWVLRCTLLGGPACQFKEETRSCLTQTGSSFSLNWDLGVFLIKRFTCCEAQDKNDRFWFKVLCFQCMRGAFMAAYEDGKGFWIAGPDDRLCARQASASARQAPASWWQAQAFAWQATLPTPFPMCKNSRNGRQAPPPSRSLYNIK